MFFCVKNKTVYYFTIILNSRQSFCLSLKSNLVHRKYSSSLKMPFDFLHILYANIIPPYALLCIIHHSHHIAHSTRCRFMFIWLQTFRCSVSHVPILLPYHIISVGVYIYILKTWFLRGGADSKSFCFVGWYGLLLCSYVRYDMVQICVFEMCDGALMVSTVLEQCLHTG